VPFRSRRLPRITIAVPADTTTVIPVPTDEGLGEAEPEVALDLLWRHTPGEVPTADQRAQARLSSSQLFRSGSIHEIDRSQEAGTGLPWSARLSRIP